MNLKEKSKKETITLNSHSNFLTNVIVNFSKQIEPVALFCPGKAHKAIICLCNE